MAIANANEGHNFQLEVCDALEQLNTTAARIKNNVSTVQTIDQIIGTLSDQLQAQQLQVQRVIKEQAQATNTQFGALAQQMQQLISAIGAAVRNNPPMPRPLPAGSQFYCQDMCDIYITNYTFRETEPALAYARPLSCVKPKAPSTDTLYNNEFSSTPPSEDNIACPAPIRCLPPAAHPFGFLDYPPDDCFENLQPRFNQPRLSLHKEDS
uniref:Uncharacterized protein n=1 Tax=Romanomermis culicivorax TaxID=13658 RepID=A0A915K2A4_ROMCU